MQPPSHAALAARPFWALRLSELESILGSRARAVAALKWAYAQPRLLEVNPAASPMLGRRSREALLAACPTSLPYRVESRAEAADGTTKYAITFGERRVEAVRIPAPGRSTICVSSQSGCTRTCRFCATATLRFKGALSAEEMVAQYLLGRAEAPLEAPARNVVFMGMGEPMDNLDEVIRAVELLTQSPAPQLRASQVTVSTSGVLPGMQRFLRESRASLALSLNASTDAQRELLMPHNRTWPIAALLEALADDRLRNPKRVHFIEYVLFEGINDAPDDARRVVELLAGVNARLNLIPHNPFPGNPYRPPPRERVLAFQDAVHRGGLRCLVRWPRGGDVAAACGQLALAQAQA